MADVKISALPASTTPLAGTEILPIVQSSTTRQVSVANLTAGRAVNALSITASSLTSGRVTYAGTAGLLQDSANLLYSGTDLTVYGLTVGRGGGAVSSNTAVGASALSGNSTGANNVAFGYQSLLNNTANNNVAYGYSSAKGNTSGVQNTAIGQSALFTNSSSSSNTAVGFTALYANTGANNTAIGDSALTANTTASNNTAVGYQSLYTQTAGSDHNSAVGHQSGYSTTTGAQNCYFGRQAGYSNATGNFNAFFGEQAGNATTSTGNTFIGRNAGYLVTSGAKNVIIGAYAGNTAPISATGSNFIVLSDGDGNVRQAIDTSGNVFWKGSGAGVFTLAGITAGTSDAKGIDNADGARLLSSRASTASREHIVFYNTNGDVGSIDTSGTLTSYNVTSDYRLKENIAPMTGALATVAQLKPVTYKWKVDGSDGQGFIAHELQAVVPDCVTGEKDAVDADGKPIHQGIDTSFLIATLVSAIQELKAEVDSLKQQLGA